MTEESLSECLSRSPMSGAQIIAVALVIALCALDGFDVFAITFVIPQVEQEWQVGKAELGIVLSAGLMGMAAGSLFISPLADIWGRRNILLPSLTLVTGGTAWSALSFGPVELGLSRLVTGLGIGATIAIINPLAAEYSNERRRDLSVMLLNLGFPVGAISGGVIAAWILPSYGWRALFSCATLLGLVLIFLSFRWLPEPVTSLLSRPGPDTLKKVNAYLRRCNQPQLSALPARGNMEPRHSALAALAKGDMAWLTLHIMTIYFLYVISLFYIQSWIPAIVAGAGFNISQAAYVSVWMNCGGIAGGILVGMAAARIGLKRAVTTSFVLGAIIIAVFQNAANSIVFLTGAGAVLGMFTIGGMVGLYAVISRNFPIHVRASGTGIVIGVGRLGSAIGPAAGGLLLSWGLGQSLISTVMAIPALLAALMLLILKFRERAS